MSTILPRTCGIYVIVCIETLKFYIGSSCDIGKRKKRHFSELALGTHRNHRLQKAWNKYGINGFDFAILELCPKHELLIREQAWLDELNPCDESIGFNIAPKASKPPNLGHRKGKKNSPEAIERMAKKLRGRKHPPRSDEHRRKISEAKKGKPSGAKGKIVSAEVRQKLREYRNRQIMPPVTDEARRKMSLSKSKTYIVTRPDGTEVVVTNLSAFCKANGLTQGVMSGVANGHHQQHKGWKCRHA